MSRIVDDGHHLLGFHRNEFLIEPSRGTLLALERFVLVRQSPLETHVRAGNRSEVYREDLQERMQRGAVKSLESNIAMASTLNLSYHTSK